MDDKKLFRMICKLILFAGAIVLGIMYSKEVLAVAKLFVGMLTPFLVGAAMAFVLNLPARFIEQKLLKKWNNPKQAGLKRGLSILLAIVFIIALLVFVILTVVPQLGRTLMELGTVVPAFFKKVYADVEAFMAEYPQLKEYFAALEGVNIDWNSIISYVTAFLKSGVSSIVSSTVLFAGNLAGIIFDGVIAFVFAIYILSGKEKLGRQVKKVLHAYLPEKGYNMTLKVIALCNQNFARFISGQCLEAVILGTMFVVCMTIFRMPYAVLVGVLIAFTALIPIVGAFIGCVVGAFLILMVSPVKALIFVIMFLVLQQLEGNLIYPRVVGNSVGLPAIWVLVAVSVGGSMFGVVGMLVFIPLMSTLYALLRENVNMRNRVKAEKAAALELQEKESEAELMREAIKIEMPLNPKEVVKIETPVKAAYSVKTAPAKAKTKGKKRK